MHAAVTHGAAAADAMQLSPQPPPLAHALKCGLRSPHAGIRLLRLLPSALDLLSLALQICQDGCTCGLPAGNSAAAGGRPGGCESLPLIEQCNGSC